MPFSKYSLIKLSAIGVFCLKIFAVHGEGFKVVIASEDSVIKMYGYIYDTISENPERINVKAKIILESLPYGSEIGIITSNDSSGYYEYYVNLAHNYRINIQSEFHRWYYENLDIRNFIQNGEISRNFYLKPQVKENQVIRLDKLIFEQGESNISPESYEELNRLVTLMSDNSSMEIQLEGHTDYRGSKKLNMKLSLQRVEAVKEYLTGEGIGSRRIKTKAYGGTQPLVKELSIEASEINRRVEVRVIKLN